MIPGEYFIDEGFIEINKDKPSVRVTVENKWDRPVQIGSFYHFFEVNASLAFDREKSFGMHLNIPAGTSVRFEPGSTKEVELVRYAGTGFISGFNGLTEGDINDSSVKASAMKRLEAFLSE